MPRFTVQLARWLAPPLLASVVAVPAVRAAPGGLPPALADADVDPPIALRGQVVGRAGAPIAGAKVELVDFARGAGPTRRLVTGSDGRFVFPALPRRSALLRIARDSHYSEIVPVDLQRPAQVAATSTGPVALTARADGRARLIFVGDTMFGRRFVDGDEDGEEGEEGDRIRPESRAEDAGRLLRFVREALASADYTLVNLECPVTDQPKTPHPYKPFVFHSHPETLAGLVSAGVDGVSSGNNHVFDYLGPGLADTLDFVAGAGLDDTGAGLNESLARDTTIWQAHHGVELALQGMSELRQDGTDADQYELVAGDPDKPGALHASRANLDEFLATAGAAFAVPVLHGGQEYSEQPTARMRELFVAAVEGGAGLVVAHHPHVLHGIGVADGPDAPRFVLMSLGNFLFDQDMQRTIESVIAVVDVEARPGGGHDIARVELIPVRSEGYVPRLLAGEGLARLGRHLGHLSTTLPARAPDGDAVDGLRGALVFPAGHRVVAVADERQVAVAEARESIALPVQAGATAEAALVRFGPADSLARVDTADARTIELGRDVMGYGDFEDHDVDGQVDGGFGWRRSESAFVQGRIARHGARAAALRRTAGHDTRQLVTTRRVPIEGGRQLTIRGYLRGEAAGAVKVRVQFLGETTLLAEEELHKQPGGTYGWTRFSTSITAPDGATGLLLGFRQTAPKRGTGHVFVDDVAVIQWELAVKPGEAIATPNAWDFLRFREVDADVATLAARLTHRRYALK